MQYAVAKFPSVNDAAHSAFQEIFQSPYPDVAGSFRMFRLPSKTVYGAIAPKASDINSFDNKKPSGSPNRI